MAVDNVPLGLGVEVENERLRFALKAAAIGTWDVNLRTMVAWWDPYTKELYGMEGADALGIESIRQLMQYVHPLDQHAVHQAMLRALDPAWGGLYEIEFRIQRQNDGQTRWLLAKGQAYFDDRGEAYRFSGTAQDITLQVEARQALAQQQAQQRFILLLSDTLRSLSDPLTMYYQTACLVGEYLGANRVGYAEDQGDDQTIVVLRNYVNGVADLQGTYQYADYGPLLDEFLAGRTVVRSDIAHDLTLTPAQREAHQLLELGATVNKPLMKEGRLMAVLFIHYRAAHSWSEDELNLVDMVAERLVVAIDRARADETLRQSEQRFRLLADAVPQAIWVTDAQGNTEFLNKWWTEYSGVSYKPTTAWQIAADLLHPDDEPLLVAVFKQAMQNGTHFELEQRNRSASGEYRWFLNKGEPYRDPYTNQITKWVGISVDIHDRKLAEHLLQQSESRLRTLAAQLEQQVQQRTAELAGRNQELATINQEYAAINQELQEANNLLARSNANLQQFAYVASHDLQEPLRKIQQFGDLLKARYTQSKGEEVDYLERMQSAAARMSTLIKDLLNYSRISTQRDASGPVMLDEVVRQVISTLELTIKETGAQILVQPLPTVLGDASQLGQLFQNLLSNALKFRRPDSTPHVEIKSRWLTWEHLPASIKPDRGTLAYHQIDVIDNGIGFDEKYVNRIFQVFQRLHGKGEYAGTGIGLAICEKVVVNHGGAITARSQPGQGTVFSIYLPV
ncbi:PAS domain-containing sensor histidine kinase [Spirosoma aerophilum]